MTTGFIPFQKTSMLSMGLPYFQSFIFVR